MEPQQSNGDGSDGGISGSGGGSSGGYQSGRNVASGGRSVSGGNRGSGGGGDSTGARGSSGGGKSSGALGSSGSGDSSGARGSGGGRVEKASVLEVERKDIPRFHADGSGFDAKGESISQKPSSNSSQNLCQNFHLQFWLVNGGKEDQVLCSCGVF